MIWILRDFGGKNATGGSAHETKNIHGATILIGGKAMDGRVRLALVLVWLAAGLFAACTQKADQIIVVMNPVGQPPRTPLIPMAPRLDKLDGKTIYIVDSKYPLTHQLFEEMQKVLSERYPKTNWIVREKAGTYMDDDPKLWEEIKAHGQGMIIGIGH
jgi:hypothetical protein